MAWMVLDFPILLFSAFFSVMLDLISRVMHASTAVHKVLKKLDRGKRRVSLRRELRGQISDIVTECGCRAASVLIEVVLACTFDFTFVRCQPHAYGDTYSTLTNRVH